MNGDGYHPNRARRVACGLTLEDVASRVGVSMMTVWRWEHGKSAPSNRATAAAWNHELTRAERRARKENR